MAASAWADMWSGALSWLQLTSICFLKLKEFMKRHKVSDDKNVICTTNGWPKDQEQQFFRIEIRALEKPWTKCISVAGEYVEKWQNMIAYLVANCVGLRTFWTPLVWCRMWEMKCRSNISDLPRAWAPSSRQRPRRNDLRRRRAVVVASLSRSPVWNRNAHLPCVTWPR